MAKIADISKYQGDVDWGRASKELLFCILRASVGFEKDTKFDRNAVECKRFGVPFHVYHYLKALDEDAARQEAVVFHQAATHTAPLFYVVDCEDDGITMLEAQRSGAAHDIVTTFVNELKRLTGGVARVAVYIGNHLYRTWNLDYASFAYVWIPKYGVNNGNPGTRPVYPCDLWQYTSEGVLDGVSGSVDLNLICGDKPLSFFLEKEATNMTYDPKKVISVALAEVGYLEKETNAQLDDKTANAGNNNRTKYARDLDAINYFNTRKQGVAWCSSYVSWCFVQAYGPEAAKYLLCQPNVDNCAAGCGSARGYFKNKGQLYTNNPQPGDQIFFYSSNKKEVSHTGLVYATDANYVYTVEGNTNSSSGVIANGGAVEKKQYRLNHGQIAGYGRPNYGTQQTDNNQTIKPNQPVTPSTTNATTNTKKKVTIVCNTGKVNIRKGDATTYDRVALLSPGAKLDYVATAANGWHAVRYGQQIAWVSGKYAVISE